MIQEIEKLKAQFATAQQSREALYQQIMEWGKKLPFFDPAWKVSENRVSGCQSEMYLQTTLRESRLYFFATSDALISSGLASLLITVYNGEQPETILLCPPLFLEELGITAALTPGRANGLSSLYLKMKQEAIRFLLPQNRSQ